MSPVVGVDVGGTFTDVVVHDDQGVRSWKTPTTSPQARGVLEAIGDHAEREGLSFLHGTTVATNALLEMTGARVVLVTSPGFEDAVEIGRQARPSLYDLSADRPPDLVSREARIGHTAIDSTLADIAAAAPESVAVCLLHSYRDDVAEHALASAIRSRFPDMAVSVGSELSPGFREYERISTTVIDAYLAPRVAGYLDSLGAEIRSGSTFVMTSAGGLTTFAAGARSVGQLTLSGPAAGVVAANELRAAKGIGSVITFDMGGTSTDVARVGPDGVVLSSSQQVGGRVNRVPSMPIHTVGAGGGSIAWLDRGGALRVGPQSAGADPGPAAYSRGGLDATVTDANVHLGYIPALGMAGSLDLSADRAAEALERLGERLGLGSVDTAVGILAVADAHMDRAIRRVSVEEGFDPRESSLVAFGGAGGLHAGRLARGLGMRSVLVPPHAGAFSALGLLMARPRVEQLETVLAPVDSPRIVDAAAGVAQRATQEFLDRHGRTPDDVELLVDVRYSSQSHELTIPYRGQSVRRDFEDEHRKRYGFALDTAEVEVVNVIAVAVGPAPLGWGGLTPPTSGGSPVEAEIWMDGATVVAEVHERPALLPGTRVAGPAVIVDGTSSILLLADDTGTVHEDGTLEINW